MSSSAISLVSKRERPLSWLYETYDSRSLLCCISLPSIYALLRNTQCLGNCMFVPSFSDSTYSARRCRSALVHW
ncbi:hypothetical protein FIBSPDRAFT_235323 [Athelia psychrophila]|uniref:Uncharacterized protein n=1 Tax=Athelia psychrophila TaxID=1759441 RepID=A0A166S025_9AGAM|nr:hypothetical protein FIBSPDRAFT_235323 [Fibularhizoctonia sp. CBS 109695]